MFKFITWPRHTWSVFDDLDSLQADMSRFLSGRGYERPAWRDKAAYPLMNVWSNADGLMIDAELPGVNPDDVDISVMGDELTLRGKINTLQPAGSETVHRRERPSGEFVRTVHLPFRADAASVKANYKNGILRLNVPRSEEEKPRKIAVQAD